MNKICWSFLLLLVFMSTNAQKVEKGVSLQLAEQRKQSISDIHYQLYFSIPPVKTAPIAAKETISFELSNNAAPLQIDFKEASDHLKQIAIDGKEVPFVFENEHIIIAPKYLKKGKNNIQIEFTAGDLSLNRNDEYLYTLLVPDRARTLFPCFDQPNLKARFTVSLIIPNNWQALTNAPLKDSALVNQSDVYVKQLRFIESDLIPTYLFSFSAGKFTNDIQQPDGRAMNFYYRETDPIKIRLSVDSIYQQHAHALQFLETYTGIKYPFEKFDFIAIPDFQYGGMEHVGAIDYKAATLFLDSGATKDQQNARSNLIAHETSHMWFGDLVTMQWFNDVWMKEVFANFMADKITQGNASNYELKFLTTHFPRAYAVDRTAGANPIRQELTNLQEAGSLYGPIIYDKAPVMMRQLERLMGEEKFRDCLRAYLKKYSFGNATWPDLISILDERTPADLQAWNKVWVNTPGRPIISYSMQSKEGQISNFAITQRGEQSTNYLLPQFFEIALIYPDRVEEHTIYMNAQQVVLKELEGKPLPQSILFNSSGQGYGLFPVDTTILHISLQSPLMRASAYINLYENMLAGNAVTPMQLIRFYQSLWAKEEEELNLSLIAGQLTDIYWHFISASQRKAIASSIEESLWNSLTKVNSANKRKVLFRTYQNIALTETDLNHLYALWKYRNPPLDIKLNEDEYTSLALAIAVKSTIDSSILERQLQRITNLDRKATLEFIIPAVSPHEKVRDQFFASLKDQKIRKKEAWVADALAYLHHPVRTSNSQKYLAQSLNMLEEIQQTGDVFFPSVWLTATFGNYGTKEAADLVRNFLKAHPHYNPKLKAKILQAADPLFRAEKLVKP